MKRRFHRKAAVIGVILLGAMQMLGLSVFAGPPEKPLITLVTPPLHVEGASYVLCTALNLHQKAVDVDIRVFNAAGEKACGAGPRTLEPGQAESQGCNSDIYSDPNPIRYCEFTYRGRENLVLGIMQAYVPEGPIGVTAPARLVRIIHGGK